MSKDTILYMIAKIIEGIIGFVALSVYTKLFLPEAFGQYNTVNITVMTASLILLGWLQQSTFRFINEYENRGNLQEFYSSAFIFWFAINLGTLLLGIVASTFAQAFTDLSTEFVTLFSLALGMFITWNTSQILLSLLAAKRIVKLNLFLSVLGITAKLVLVIILVNAFGSRISFIVLSNFIADGFIVVAIIFKLKLFKFISFKQFSKQVIKKFLNYGTPLVAMGITAALLNISDRYIILFFQGAKEVGVYSANYTLASAAFTMILTGVMRGVYPTILQTWKGNNKEETEKVLSRAVRYFLLISIPAFVGLAVLSKTIALLILDAAYIDGYVVITWVALGMFFLGLTEYSNKAWELTAKTKVILKYCAISAAINVSLNLILIPIWGYKVAAITTTLSYLIYLVLSLRGSRKLLTWHLPFKTYFNIGISAIVMGLSLLLALSVFKASWFMLLILVVLGFLIYFVSLALTREITSEINAIAARLKR